MQDLQIRKDLTTENVLRVRISARVCESTLVNDSRKWIHKSPVRLL